MKTMLKKKDFKTALVLDWQLYKSDFMELQSECVAVLCAGVMQSVADTF